jgi:hypothetical protein
MEAYPSIPKVAHLISPLIVVIVVVVIVGVATKI